MDNGQWIIRSAVSTKEEKEMTDDGGQIRVSILYG